MVNDIISPSERGVAANSKTKVVSFEHLHPVDILEFYFHERATGQTSSPIKRTQAPSSVVIEDSRISGCNSNNSRSPKMASVELNKFLMLQKNDKYLSEYSHCSAS